jgi:hypothetical protein
VGEANGLPIAIIEVWTCGAISFPRCETPA